MRAGQGEAIGRQHEARSSGPLLFSFAVCACPSTAWSAEVVAEHLRLWWCAPFIGLLASIAVFPLVAADIWHRHVGKIVSIWAASFVLPFCAVFGFGVTYEELTHALLLEYVPFVLLLFALFTVAGGIGIFGRLRGTPMTNTLLLAIGAVAANIMGTTGAAMVLVRPLIRTNRARTHNVHVLMFFIFIVANAGGALTPLGDPPLFLGFLNGVSFFWTASVMFAPTACLVGALLVIFYLVDRWFERKTPLASASASTDDQVRLHIEGWLNVGLLIAIAACVLISGLWHPGVAFRVGGAAVEWQNLARDIGLVAIAGLSLATTRHGVRAANDFNWAPLTEVAKLFAGIFVTIVPVILILQAGNDGAAARLTELVTRADGEAHNAMYFWLTGVLSAFLDNAPTYLVFFNLAGGDANVLMTHQETLRAISAGAVFMGALTYLGNAPNLMVWAIAVDRGIRMPSFFGYLRWSLPILLPLFVLITFLFFG